MQADLQQPLSDVLPDDYRGRFDVVTATAFLHYLDDPEAALDNARWLLRDEGVLIISVPARWVLKCRLNPVVMLGKPVGATRQVRTRSSWLQLFEQSGWTVQRTFNCHGSCSPCRPS